MCFRMWERKFTSVLAKPYHNVHMVPCTAGSLCHLFRKSSGFSDYFKNTCAFWYLGGTGKSGWIQVWYTGRNSLGHIIWSKWKAQMAVSHIKYFPFVNGTLTFGALLTLKVIVATIDAEWEGMGDVGSARYEAALLPPCSTIMVLSYSN